VGIAIAPNAQLNAVATLPTMPGTRGTSSVAARPKTAIEPSITATLETGVDEKSHALS
jgi:hypothetical protein